uniref:NAD-dependent protein deacylase n=1 Tax=Strigamia maritima TaxID=126957 RepID=T1JHL2_STRMM
MQIIKLWCRHASQLIISNFVPRHLPVKFEDVNKLQDFLSSSSRLLVITGAGISTESGIPDYRSEGVGLYVTSQYRPVQYQEFVKNSSVRRSFWARNYVGWPRFSNVEPNIVHLALSKWEKAGRLNMLVTQNVEKLHSKAGSELVTELHGSAFRVICLTCHNRVLRDDLQTIISSNNTDFTKTTAQIRPDGDVELHQGEIENFNVPSCLKCGGILKPDIVFFGENVPMNRVNFVYGKIKEADKILVLGSSLQVYSAYRFMLAARKENKPIAIVNIGATRADDLAEVKVNARCGEVLPKLNLS